MSGHEIDYTFFLDAINIKYDDDVDIDIHFYSNDMRLKITERKRVFQMGYFENFNSLMKDKSFVRREDKWTAWEYVFRFENFEVFKEFFLKIPNKNNRVTK